MLKKIEAINQKRGNKHHELLLRIKQKNKKCRWYEHDYTGIKI